MIIIIKDENGTHIHHFVNKIMFGAHKASIIDVLSEEEYQKNILICHYRNLTAVLLLTKMVLSMGNMKNEKTNN